MSTLVDEYRATRRPSTNGHHPARRDPLLRSAGRFLGQHLPRWQQARTAVFTWPAAGLVTWAAAVTDGRLGALTAAASLLVLEWAGKPE